ncbi:hypothetical protein P5V15_001156 [Pogonomyrmex californicus]
MEDRENERMKVGERIDSDHMLLEVTLKDMKEEDNNKEEKRVLIDWSEKGIKEYVQKVKTFEETEIWKKFKEQIQGARKECNKRQNKNKEKWWECKEKREKVGDMFKKWKEEKIDRVVYLEERKEYRTLLENKKLNAGEKLIEDNRIK